MKRISDNTSLTIQVVFQTLCIAGFLLPAIRILPLYNVGLWSRVLVVALGTLFVVRMGWFRSVSLLHPLLAAGVLWVSLCLASSTWSDVPSLTLLKGSFAAAVFVCGTFAGFALGRATAQSSKALQPLAIVGLLWGALTILSVLSGRSFDPRYGRFIGPTDNHNMYAAAAGCFAFSTMEYLRGKLPSHKGVWKLLVELSPLAWAWTIFLSGSRGGMLLFVIVASISLASGALNRNLARALIFAGALLPLLYALENRSVVGRVDAFFYKQEEAKFRRDPFYSRRPVWEETMAAIALTGPMGAGFGVFADWRLDRLPLLTSVGYGREHGSAWLAVREQLGYAGQAAFLLLGVALLLTLGELLRYKSKRACSSTPLFAIAVALGLYGLSFFEAWTVSPAAPESMIFWSSVGIAAGAAVCARQTLLAERQAAIAAPSLLQPLGAIPRP